MEFLESTKIFKELDGKDVLAISYSQLDMFLKCPHRWKLSYLDGIRFDGVYEALEYGTCIHETYEYYAKNKSIGKRLEFAEMEEFFVENFNNKEIPFEKEEDKDKAINDANNALKRLSDSSGYIEKLINKCDIIGVEEEFILPVDVIIDVNDNLYENVYIYGAIDLILRTESGDIIIIDHKSGKKKFDKGKLSEDLQFPIYAKYIKEKYGVIPKRCFYNFTRIADFQEVKVTEEIIKETQQFIKNTIKRMYNFNKYKSNPTPLCYWCDFSKSKHDICEGSSDWLPKDKRENKEE